MPNLKIWTIIISILGAAASAFFARRANIFSRKSNMLGANASLYEHHRSLMILLLEHNSELIPYLTGETLPKDEIMRYKVLAITKLWIDFFEDLVLKIDSIDDGDLGNRWRAYAFRHFTEHSLLRKYVQNYSPEYSELLSDFIEFKKPYLIYRFPREFNL